MHNLEIPWIELRSFKLIPLGFHNGDGKILEPT